MYIVVQTAALVVVNENFTSVVLNVVLKVSHP